MEIRQFPVNSSPPIKTTSVRPPGNKIPITVRMTDTFSMACPAVFVAAAPKAMKNPANIPKINMDNAGSSVFFFPASP